MSRIAYVCIAAATIGAGIGWTLHGDNGSHQSIAASMPMPASPPQLQATPATGIDVALLRTVIREELGAAMASERSGQPAVNPVSQTPAPPELVAQRHQAIEEIETMINGGQWGNEQRTSFQQKMAMLDPEAAERALQRLTIALNEGAIRVTTEGPPL